MKRTLSVTAVAAALLLAPLAVADAAPSAPYYKNCAAAFAAGQSNIKQGEPGYRAPLDRNRDGVACEKDDPAAMNNGMGPRDEEAASGASDGQDNSDDSATEDTGTSDEDGSDDGTADDGASDDEGTEDSSDSDQVGVVPEGGAPTGDGSTETGVGWWVGGGLLMTMAGAGLALRQRVFGRS